MLLIYTFQAMKFPEHLNLLKLSAVSSLIDAFVVPWCERLDDGLVSQFYYMLHQSLVDSSSDESKVCEVHF